MDISDLKMEFDNHQSNYTQSGNLDLPMGVNSTWTKTSPTLYSFTKSYDDSKIEIFYSGQVRVSSMHSVGACQIRIRVDNSNIPKYDNYGVLLPEPVAVDAMDWESVSIMPVFKGLSAGQHTVSLWARNCTFSE